MKTNTGFILLDFYIALGITAVLILMAFFTIRYALKVRGLWKQ